MGSVEVEAVMWKVYREVARERLGVFLLEGAEVWRYSVEADAWAAFWNAVNSLLEQGFRYTLEVTPQSFRDVEDWAGFEAEGAVALVVLYRTTPD